MKQLLLNIFLVSLVLTVLLSCEKQVPKLLAENKVLKAEIDPSIIVEPFNLKTNNNPALKQDINRSLENYYHLYWEKNNLSGNFLVAKNGEVFFEKGQGVADRLQKKSLTKHTPLHIASVSKVLTSTAVLKLADAQRIDLDQKVAEILPDFPYPFVTVRMLLNHRSGLPHYSNFTAIKGVWNTKQVLKNQDVFDLLKKHQFKLIFIPDSQFNYCNTNYVLLALIVEKVTGLNFREAMKKMIFEPLKMNNTYIFDYQLHKDTCSQSYVSSKKYEFNYMDDLYGDKNVYSTPRDLLKFDLATYSPKFLSKELREQVYRGYSNEIKGINNYGLGIRMSNLYNGKTIYFHNGWWHGNTSSYTTIKHDTVTIIALSNRYTKIVYNARSLHRLFEDYNTYKMSVR